MGPRGSLPRLIHRLPAASLTGPAPVGPLWGSRAGFICRGPWLTANNTVLELPAHMERSCIIVKHQADAGRITPCLYYSPGVYAACPRLPPKHAARGFWEMEQLPKPQAVISPLIHCSPRLTGNAFFFSLYKHFQLPIKESLLSSEWPRLCAPPVIVW